ncbi:MAG: hypothetical protein LBE60_14555 [Microbacterium sp.]|uniref:hypothetical protein n=1 Tax=Microbacterium sp. TaxID=51671 RepID=UPI002829949A|nr:hypothetical protein [Microbacterium sp.]MDR2322854.1 hypothetical protein [Microbacterium sp.]
MLAPKSVCDNPRPRPGPGRIAGGGTMGITAGALVAVFVALFIVLVVRRRK